MGDKIRSTTIEVLLIFVVGIVIGTIMAIASNLLILGVQKLTSIRDGDSFQFELFGHDFSILLFLWISAGAVILVRKIFDVNKYAGPAQSIHAAQQTKHPLNIRLGLASTVAAFASAGGGASVGLYGPLVHFGSTIGTVVQKYTDGLLKKGMSTDIFLGCGVAAAISAGFSAPLAGLVFAHEAILRHFSVRAIAPIAVASVTAKAVNDLFFPGQAAFVIESGAFELLQVVPILVIVSPFIALVAIFFMSGLRQGPKLAKGLCLPAWQLIILAATVCGIVGMIRPEVLGLGTFEINQMLAGKLTSNFSILLGILFLITILLLKIILTSVCVGFGLFGGIFSPALFVGAAAGAIIGKFAILAGAPDLVATAIATAAMAAVASSVIGAPITAVLIIFELTQSYDFAVAALMAVMPCALITHRLFGHSFFDRQLLDAGIDLIKGREALALAQNEVSPYAGNDFVELKASDTGSYALSLLEQKNQTEAYVISEKNMLLGKLSIHQAISAAEKSVDVFMDKKPIVLKGDDSLAGAMEIVSKFVGESLPVTEDSSGILLGTVTEGDLFQAVINVQETVRHTERD